MKKILLLLIVMTSLSACSDVYSKYPKNCRTLWDKTETAFKKEGTDEAKIRELKAKWFLHLENLGATQAEMVCKQAFDFGVLAY